MTQEADPGAMSTADKLRLLEEPRVNLSASATDVPSPAWHGDVLAERERLTASGEETFIPWADVRKLFSRPADPDRA